MASGKDTKGNYSNADTDWQRLWSTRNKNPSWHELARCADKDSDLFNTGRGASGASIAAARAICRRCEVRVECIEEGINLGGDDMIVGGFTPKERERFKDALKKVRLDNEILEKLDDKINIPYSHKKPKST